MDEGIVVFTRLWTVAKIAVMNLGKISIQGQIGSYHHQVANNIFGDDIKLLPRATFKHVFEDVTNGRAEFGIVAIENSSVGSINEVYDLLRQSDLYIVGEHYMRISHCLIGLPQAKLADITNIHSHPMAILQCEDYIEKNLPNADVHERHDTAESVEYIIGLGDKSQTAIASAEAAKLHGARVIARNIETDKHNYTRFLVLHTSNADSTDVNKTSIMIELADRPGSLYHALGCFEEEGINLSKIESRPILGKGWRYYFYIDFEAGMGEERTERALKALSRQGHELKILGSYQKGEMG